MQHQFNINIAKEYGILEAVILNHLQFWIAKNAANEKNYHDGTYWTYNSTKAFAKLFPYVTERQIMYALKKLKEAGLIKTGNYNKNAYDRTLWYALTKKGESILQESNLHFTNLSNGNDTVVEPIPDNKPDNKPDNTITKVIGEPPKSYGNEDINHLFEEWERVCGFRVDSKVKQNRYACQRLIKSKGIDNVIKALPYVAESHADRYAPAVNNFIDLAEKWNSLGVWVKKKYSTESKKYGKIVI